jgi:hypothetical protein
MIKIKEIPNRDMYSNFQNKCPILLTFILLKSHIPISFETLVMKIGIKHNDCEVRR